ncbi:hypothetical protein MKX01_002369 [Papaver californicum]|nr:hypothetical protein MKX01_002369 [Papaver californicum]
MFIVEIFLLLYNKVDFSKTKATQIVKEMFEFMTILSRAFVLHKTKDMVDGGANSSTTILFCPFPEAPDEEFEEYLRNLTGDQCIGDEEFEEYLN